MKPKYFLFFLLMMLSQFNAVAQSTIASKPNIIFILADDLGYADLSFTGGKDVRTPHIDALASKGIFLKNFYANSTVCSPSRAALLTGKYPDLVGVPGVIRQQEKDSWGYLKEDAILLPAVLKKSGYQTAIIGKWHLGFEKPNIPNSKGFDHFKGFLGDMMDDYYTHRRDGINWMRENEKEIDPKGHATDLFTDWAIDYVVEKNKSTSPFFLYLAYNAPHFPIQPPVEFLEKVKQREPDATESRAKNIALVEHLDASIGKLMATLEASGQLNNTIIVFSSDNGGSLPHGQSNGTLNGGKQDMLEGGIKVPAVVVWNNKIKAGSSSDQLALLMDFFPTLANIAGATVEHKVNGINLRSVLKGSAAIQTDRTVYWMRREGGQHNGLAYYAARKGNFKILQNNPFEAFKGYDLEKDPLEKNPINPKDHEPFKALKFSLQEHIRATGKVPWQQPN
jgi:arylsulfatase A-like enzyme